MGEIRRAYRVLVGRSEGKRPFGKPRHIVGYHKNGSLRNWMGVHGLD
jgi:hypothetical protein